MKYKLLIIWGNVEPELDSRIHDEYEDLVKQARLTKETEGDENGLFYLEWEEILVGDCLVKSHVEVHPFGSYELERVTRDFSKYVTFSFGEEEDDEFPYGSDRSKT